MISDNHVIKHRKLYMALPVLLALLFLVPLRHSRINTDLNTYLPDDIPAKIKQDTLEKIFGKTEMVVLIFEAPDVLNKATLERISNLDRAFRKMPEFRSVLSLFSSRHVHSEDGAMVVDPAVRKIPVTDSERESLRDDLSRNELVSGVFVSADFRYALVMLNPAEGVKDATVFELINGQLTRYPGEERVHINGMPYLRYQIQKIAIKDLAVLMPLGLIIMILFLYFSFGEKRGVMLPLSVVAMSIILSMGLIPLLGWEFSLVAVLIPIIMIAVANNYAVHLVARYQEFNAIHNNWPMEQIVDESLVRLKKPILMTGLTTIFGIMGLVTYVMLPTKQIGVVASVGVAFALILSLTYVPAILSRMRKGKVQKSFSGQKQAPVDKMLAWAGNTATLYPKFTIAAFVLAFVLAGLGIFRLQAGINHEKMMPRHHNLRTSTEILNSSFNGNKYITLMFEGDIKDPALLGNMDHYKKELEKLPEVGKVTSLADIILLISRSLNEAGDSLYDVIPGSRDAVAQYIELYMMGGDPEDFEQLVDFNYTRALVNIQFSADDLKAFNRVLDRIDELTRDDPFFRLEAGSSVVEKQLAESIIQGQWSSVTFAFTAIVIVIALIFRSLFAGLLGIVPLVFCLVCNFGLMGWFGLELDIATSLLSSVAIGIGVDYTIHFFWRYKTEMESGADHATSIRHTLRTTGRGITINAFSVMIGFAVLFLSGLIILKTFAFLIIFSLLLCLVCALVLIPAICMVTKPVFLKTHQAMTGEKGRYRKPVSEPSVQEKVPVP